LIVLEPAPPPQAGRMKLAINTSDKIANSLLDIFFSPQVLEKLDTISRYARGFRSTKANHTIFKYDS